MKNVFKKYSTFFFILFLTIVGVSLALHIIGRDIWYDEAYTGIVARMPWDAFWTTVSNDVHPPLYYVAVKLWGLVFGYSAEAIRALSLTSYVFCIPLVYFLGLLHSHKTAYATTAIFAFSPFFLGYATEARMYMLLCLFVLIGFAALLRFLYQKKSYAFLVLSAAALGAASLTHYFGIVASAAAFFTIVYTYRAQLGSSAFWKAAIGFSMISALVFLPWLPTLLGQRDAAASFGWIPATDLNRLPESLYIFLYGNALGAIGVSPANSFVLFLPAIILFSIMLLGLVKAFRNGRELLVKLLLLAFVPVVALLGMSLFGANLYLERYLLPFGVVWVMLLVIAVQALFTIRLQMLFLALYIVSVSIFNAAIVATSSDFPPVLTTVKNEPVIVDNAFDYTVIKFYRPNGTTFLYNAENPAVDFSGWNIIEESDVLKNIQDRSGTSYIRRTDGKQLSVELVQ